MGIKLIIMTDIYYKFVCVIQRKGQESSESWKNRYNNDRQIYQAVLIHLYILILERL